MFTSELDSCFFVIQIFFYLSFRCVATPVSSRNANYSLFSKQIGSKFVAGSTQFVVRVVFSNFVISVFFYPFYPFPRIFFRKYVHVYKKVVTSCFEFDFLSRSPSPLHFWLCLRLLLLRYLIYKLLIDVFRLFAIFWYFRIFRGIFGFFALFSGILNFFKYAKTRPVVMASFFGYHPIVNS